MIINQLENVLDYNICENDIIVLTELRNTSVITRYSSDLDERWTTETQLSYSLFSFEGKIYTTTKNQPSKTLVFDAKTGSVEDSSEKVVLHLPILIKENDKVISFASEDQVSSFILFDKDMKKISELNPKRVKVTRAVDTARFLSFQKEVLSLVDFYSSEIIWEVNLHDLISAVEEPPIKLKLWECYTTDDILVISILNIKASNQFLVSLDIKTGILLWTRKGLNNTTIENGELISLSYKGILDTINPSTGLVHSSIDLTEDFVKKAINCDKGLNLDGNMLLFKDDVRKKIGIVSESNQHRIQTLELPQDVILSANEYPQSIDDKFIIHSPLNRKLYITKLQNQLA